MENPREYDNYCTMICFHRRYNLGDKHSFDHRNYSGWDEMQKAIEKEYKFVEPLYMMDHSGLTIQRHPFGGIYGRFDSGRIGFIAVKKDKDHSLRRKKTIEIMDAELESYNNYINGYEEGYYEEEE